MQRVIIALFSAGTFVAALSSCTTTHPKTNDIGIEFTRLINERSVTGMIVIGDQIPADMLPPSKRREIEGQLRWHWMRNGNIPNACFYLEEGEGSSGPTFGVTYLSGSKDSFKGNLLVWPDASYSIELLIDGQNVSGETRFSGGPVIIVRNEDGSESEDRTDSTMPISGHISKDISIVKCLNRIGELP